MSIDRLTRTASLDTGTLLPVFTSAGQDDQAATMATLVAFTRTQIYGRSVPVNVTGSRASGAALVSLLLALSQLGLITDNTTA